MWDRMRPQFKALGVRYDRVESPATAPSFPDLAYTWAGSHGFIEMKAATVNQRGNLDLHHFTAGQRTWLRQRAAGGKTWLLVRGIDEDQESWYAIKGTLAFGIPERISPVDLEAYCHTVHRGPLDTKWLRSWL